MSHVTVELDADRRITLTGWVGADTPKKCKAIPGGRFHKKTDTERAHWSYPLDMRTCRLLRSQFGDALVIGPKLNRWARAQKAKEEGLTELAKASDSELFNIPKVAPTMHAAMATRRYQRVAAAWGKEVGNFLLADEQGLGKTIETLATIIEAADKPQWHIVFSPSVAVDTVWAGEALRWLGRDMKIAVVPLLGSLKQRQQTLTELDIPYETEHVFVVVNIESARIKPVYDAEDTGHKNPRYLAKNAVLPALHARVWDTVIVDECQRALIRVSGKPNQTRAGFELLSKNSYRRIALSGTPMRGKPTQLWGTLHWLRPDVYTAYWKWVDTYFARKSDGYSNYVIDGFQPGGEDRLAKDMQSIMLRRTKQEVLPELPPKTYAGTLMDPGDDQSPCGIWLDMSKGQRKQLDEIERNGLLDFGAEGEMIVDHQFAVAMRQKQIANAVHTLEGEKLVPTLDSPKYEWLRDFLTELDGKKVVVASQFTSIIDVFANELESDGYSVAKLTGKTAAGKRKEMVDKFQNTEEIQVFMLNTKAGGVALTLDAADYLVLLDETPIPDDQAQVEDRIHRASRMHNVTIYYLRTLGTLDEETAWIAAARESVQRYLMDGARGVKYAKALYYTKKGQ